VTCGRTAAWAAAVIAGHTPASEPRATHRAFSNRLLGLLHVRQEGISMRQVLVGLLMALVRRGV
jgi:hypothetical protein